MHRATRNADNLIPDLKISSVVLCILLIFTAPMSATASIIFEDVSQDSGINRVVQTAGSGWGDLNGDGWPDLWVSNHDLTEPSLYLNQKDGTFIDVIETAVITKQRADFHGAAWADFDNDGDQDLFLISGGASGRGYSPNFLLVNTDSKLVNAAKELGVDYPLGRGRTPLWFDADQDGKLDLLLVNRTRAKGKFPSAVFLQTANGFKLKNIKLGFNPIGKKTNIEKIKNLLDNAIHFRFRKGAGEISSAEQFAQLSDITGDGTVELLAYINPMRVYSTQNIPFKDITNDMDLPSSRAVQDIAIEDFNGDGKLDMFLAISTKGSDVVNISPSEIRGTIKKGSAARHKEVRFQSSGKVTFEVHMPWRDPTDPQKEPPRVWVGNHDPIPAVGRIFELSPDDPSIHQGVPLPGRSIAIHYDPTHQRWNIRSSYPAINFKARSTKPIDQIEAIGFTTSKGEKKDILLLNNGDGFSAAKNTGVTTQPTACGSVAAGDFDNDMDIDLYLVCRESVQNTANILYENDGTGRFKKIPVAGGAAGSYVGRGNQVSMCDYDQDGFLDLFITNGIGDPPFSIGPHQLFRNKGNENHWLEVDLEGSSSNRDGIGAIVELDAGGVKQLRVQDGGIHSVSQNHQRLHFGLGDNKKIDRLTIRWPSGIVQKLNEISTNQILKIVEADGKK